MGERRSQTSPAEEEARPVAPSFLFLSAPLTGEMRDGEEWKEGEWGESEEREGENEEREGESEEREGEGGRE